MNGRHHRATRDGPIIFVIGSPEPSSLSDLNIKSLISLEFMFLTRKTKLNDINMLSITPTSSPTGC